VSGEPDNLRLCDQLLGMDRVVQHLSRARARDRLAQSYLFLGPRGCGKTRLALAFAQELLCRAASPPCGVCPPCRQAAHLTHPDLHLVVPAAREDAESPDRMAAILVAYARDRYHQPLGGAAESIGIDRIRALKEEAAKAPVAGTRRVIVLSGADRMTEQAAQATLKLVEEPPPGTLLILVAGETTDVLPTLVSRCQRVRVPPLGRERLHRVLAGELGIPSEEAHLLAALSGGSLGRAAELRGLDVRALRDRLRAAFDFPPESAPAPAEVERRVRSLERIWTGDVARVGCELLLAWLRDCVAARTGLDASDLANPDLAGEAHRIGRALAPVEIGRRMRVVEDMAEALGRNCNPALALHAALWRTAGGPGSQESLFRP
jgi:DNA polymerase III subunit delta'